MRILHLIPSLKKGGAERLCLDMVQALARKGADVRIAVLHPENEFTDEFPNLHTHRLHAHVIPSLSKAWNVKLNDWQTLLDDYRPTVVHSHLYEAEMVSRYAPRPGIRYFTHCHDNMRALHRFAPADLGSKKRLTELYERHFLLKQYRRCHNTFLAISADTRHYFLQNLPAQAGTVTLLPNAIDLERFTQKADAPKAGEVLQLLNVGSFWPIKNQAFLLDVLARLRQRGINTRLSFVGDGPERERVTQQAIHMGLAEHVTFLGQRSDIPTLLAQAHVYVHAGKKEGFGLVLVEAMAAGLPVVTLDGGGNRDLIQNEKNGYILPLPDADAFADAIQKTAQASTWPTMARQARDFAAGYGMDAYAEHLLHLYQSHP